MTVLAVEPLAAIVATSLRLDLLADVSDALDLMRDGDDPAADILLVQIVHEGARPTDVVRECVAQTGGTL